MCRLLGYVGATVALDQLLYKPEHSLIVQSYQPREMTAGTLNADGFGVGWYHPHKETEPYSYRSIQPIWGDVNLPSLSRYVEAGLVLGCVRSATPGLPVDLSNCQPFQHGRLMGIHNGFIANFRQTLYRPLRDRLSDTAYHLVLGNTDSEHLFALVVQQLEDHPDLSLAAALRQALELATDLAAAQKTRFSANLILSDGEQLVASRYAYEAANPSLYWLRDDVLFPGAVVVASEPMFAGDWVACRDRSLLIVHPNLEVETHAL